jgi:23S rRNA (guanosine2251-2'-O)-methyltransferase
MHNVGSVFRTADAADVKKIYLCGITPAPLDKFGKLRPQLAKVALGAEKSVAWDASARSAQAVTNLLKKLKNEGYKIFAIEQDKKSIPYYTLKLPRVGSKASRRAIDKIALILGNEVKGLPQFILRCADKILEIPMRGVMVRQACHPRRVGRGKESLNVAVAFGIVAFGLLYMQRRSYN